MQQNLIIKSHTFKVPEKIKNFSYRGFVSIDQEMEREIAMKFFTPKKGTPTKNDLALSQ